MNAAAIVILALAGMAHAQADAPVERPHVKPGDRWTYRYIEYIPASRTSTISSEVTFADEHAIHLVSTQDGGEKENDVTFTAEWNLVASRRSGIYDPHNGMFRFPMRPGDSWPSRYRVSFPRESYYSDQDRIARVEGWEEVDVPAGRFRALKIVAEGASSRSDRPLSGRTREVMWYAPQVKRYVKWTYEAGSVRRTNHSFEYQLVDYKLQ